MIQLPDYFIRKVSGYPAGIRLTKMTKWYSSNTNNFKPFLPFTPNLSGGYKSDPLNGGDYRYWRGLPSSASIVSNRGFAICRCCEQVVCSKDARKEHKKLGCGGKLEDAYNMLKRSKQCIICNLATNKKVYGLPL